MPELTIDENPTHSAVAVTERMNRFKIQMEPGNFVGKVTDLISPEPDSSFQTLPARTHCGILPSPAKCVLIAMIDALAY